jgi:hypothetical protein
MPIILGPQWWWNYFKKLFGLKDFTRGGMALSSGWHEIFVPTSCKPASVMLTSTDYDTPCCGGTICLYATCLLPDGFILYADVRTDSCEIEWIIQYDEDVCPTPPPIFP